MKTFCICVPENPKAIDLAREHFSSIGLDGVEFIWGIHAKTAGLSTEFTYEIDNPGSGWKMGYACTGIWLSHYMLWTVFLHSNEESMLVLEDDVLFSDGWKQRMESALSCVPSNFDYLSIGACCTDGHHKKHVAGEVWETKHIQCTHAYIIKRKAVQVLIRMRKVWAPVDIQMQLECFEQLRTFAVLPRICNQRGTELPT